MSVNKDEELCLVDEYEIKPAIFCLASGQVFCWGSNQHGQCGRPPDKLTKDHNQLVFTTPQLIGGLLSNVHVTQLKTGWSHLLAITGMKVWRYRGGIAADIIWFYMPILSKSLCRIYFKLLVTTLFCQKFVNRLFFLLVVVMHCTLFFALSTCHTKTFCLPHVISVVPYNSESPSYNCFAMCLALQMMFRFFHGAVPTMVS